MKNNFFRKIGFGLSPIEEIPDKPLEWAINQVSSVPDYSWKEDMPKGSDLLKIYGNFIFQDRKVLREKYKTDPNAYRKAKNKIRHEFGVKYFESLEIAIRHDAVINGKNPVSHRFLHFWGNHFAISQKDFMSNYTTGPYHRETIGPALTGSFFDLLKKATTSWSMIHHLDNSDSVGPSSEVGIRRLKRGKVSTINENHARELLELHTVSPSLGYTQQDVINTTFLMTGWEHKYSKKYLECGPVKFNHKKHEPGSITILGKKYKQSGLTQETILYDLLEDLANHPSTIRFISWKLCRHFLSDFPPIDAVKAVENAWKDSNGKLPSIHQAVIEQTWKYTGLEKKFLMPETWLLQVAKLCDAYWPNSSSQMKYNFKSPPNNFVRRQEKIMRELGHAPFRAEQPNGYPDTETEWMSPELLIRRLGLVNIEKLNRLGIKTNNVNKVLENNFDNSNEIKEHLDKLLNEEQKMSVLLSSSWMLKV